MEGHTDSLFAADRQMMDYELWEGLHKNTLDLLASKYAMIPQSKIPTDNPWTDADTVALFPHSH